VGYSSRITRRCCVVLDTNVLLLLADGVNIFEQIDEILFTKCEYIILSQVLRELEKIAGSKRNVERRKARYVLSLLREFKDKYNIKILSINDKGYPVDDILVETALALNCYIASNDKALRSKARRKNIPEIYYREEKGMLEASKEFI